MFSELGILPTFCLDVRLGISGFSFGQLLPHCRFSLQQITTYSKSLNLNLFYNDSMTGFDLKKNLYYNP